jgi:hypothetical protein
MALFLVSAVLLAALRVWPGPEAPAEVPRSVTTTVQAFPHGGPAAGGTRVRFGGAAGTSLPLCSGAGGCACTFGAESVAASSSNGGAIVCDSPPLSVLSSGSQPVAFALAFDGLQVALMAEPPNFTYYAPPLVQTISRSVSSHP